MLVLVDDATESVVSTDVGDSDVEWVGDRRGYCPQRRGLLQRLVSAVAVVVRFVLAQGMQQVTLIRW